METFQFAQILFMKRQELHLTQEDIAKYVGVSRAAVSKWEKGLSYPDITILPKLATFFNISIDTLLGYKPQMTKEQISPIFRTPFSGYQKASHCAHTLWKTPHSIRKEIFLHST